MAKNEVYLEGEILFVKTDDENIDIYLGDGVTSFADLKPIFSTQWVMGRNEVNLTPVQLKATDWVNNTQTKTVMGVLANESEQLILPAWAGQSKDIAQSCGIDFIVRQDGALDFTCNVTPTEDVIVYIGIFGKLSENEGDNQAFIKTNIDTTLSTSSTNPVENRVITAKIDSIEASIRGITGGDGGDSDTSLSAIVDKLNNISNYTTTVVPVGKYTDNETLNKITLTFSNLVISKETMRTDSDIATFDIGKTVTIDTLAYAHWAGKTSTGEFFSGCNVYIDTAGKVYIIGLPVNDTAYNFTGSVTLEYIA